MTKTKFFPEGWHPKNWEKTVAKYPSLQGAEPTVVEYEPIRNLLEQTNSYVNATTEYKFERAFDSDVNCAGHTRKKIEALVAKGVPRGALHFTVVSMPMREVEVKDEATGEMRKKKVWDGMHAILTVDTTDGVKFLGNIRPYPGALESMPYDPYMRETNGRWEDMRP